jgi:hypothetical protein
LRTTKQRAPQFLHEKSNEDVDIFWQLRLMDCRLLQSVAETGNKLLHWSVKIYLLGTEIDQFVI